MNYQIKGLPVRWKRYFLLGLLSFLALSLGADDSDPVLALIPFEGDRIGDHQIRVLEDYITSEILSTRDYRIVSREKRSEVLNEIEFSQTGLVPRESRINIGRQLSAAGLIGGRITQTENQYILSLTLIKTLNGEVLRSETAAFSSLTELLSGSPALTRKLLGYQNRQEGDDLSLDLAVGSWQGDKGIRRVTLFADGTGTAEMAGWATMKLSVRVDGQMIIIAQAEPNRPDLYSGFLPFGVANQLAEKARPMRWIFELSQDGNILEGIKETTSFRVESGVMVEIDNNYSRAARWTRIQ